MAAYFSSKITEVRRVKNKIFKFSKKQTIKVEIYTQPVKASLPDEEVSFSFLFFLRESRRERECGRREGPGRREKQTLHGAGSLMPGSIPGPRDHGVSRRQMLN